MSQVLKTYTDRFSAKLAAARDYQALLVSCHDQGVASKLLAVAQNVVASDWPDDEAASKALFVAFLKGDGDTAAVVASAHGRSLAAFDAFGTPRAAELKAAGQKMLESEFAAWYAHKQLLDAIVADAAVSEELDTDETLQDLISTGDGFALHEQLAFGEIWADIFPDFVSGEDD